MSLDRIKNGCVISLSEYSELLDELNLDSEQKPIRKDGLIQMCAFKLNESGVKIETTKKCFFVDTNKK